jgi:hypothetical protein
MKIFPNDNFKIRTRTKKAEILKILSDNIEPIKDYRGSIFSSVSQNKFEGEAFGDEFNIQRIIYARNIFNPKIIGNIESTEDETEININFEISYYERIIFTIIFAFLLVFQLLSIFKNFENSKITLSSFIATFFVIFIYLMMRLKYNFEIKSAKIELNELFKK